MPRTAECDYCGTDIEPGTGTMLVLTDGTTIDYCSSKCEKNADLGREPRDLEWTAAGRPETDEAEQAPAEDADGESETEEPEPADEAEATADEAEETDDEVEETEAEQEEAEA